MDGLHRNSQKRIYVPDGIYFITINTYQKHPYFENEVLCELFLETLDFTSLIKEFNLHGLAINPDHLHLLIEPTGKYNYSEIMGTLKRNFTRDCNDLISERSFRRDGKTGGGSEKSNSRAERFSRKYIDIRGNQFFKTHLERLVELQTGYLANGSYGEFIQFKWQGSFRDHLIKDEQDYRNHLGYIVKQPLKHQLQGRTWYWVADGDDNKTVG